RAGLYSYKGRVVKVGADKVREEVQENIMEGKKWPSEVQTWTRTKETARPTSGTQTAAVAKKDMTPAEKAFQEYGDYWVGGVWTTTTAQGMKGEWRYQWILDRFFLQLNGKEGNDSSHEIYGIDPVTQQWTFWGFDNKGRVYRATVESEK